jgi:hypothetical protein
MRSMPKESWVCSDCGAERDCRPSMRFHRLVMHCRHVDLDQSDVETYRQAWDMLGACRMSDPGVEEGGAVVGSQANTRRSSKPEKALATPA